MDTSAPLEVAGRELHQGERLIWAERAGVAALARSKLGTALLGVPFTAFALFWTVTATHLIGQAGNAAGPMRLFFPLWGLLFVFAGLSLLLAPLWAAWQGLATFYAITDQRLLIVTRFPRYRVRSLLPAELNVLERATRPDGSGDLVFREELPSWQVNRTRRTVRIGFYGIPDVLRVEDEVRRLVVSSAGVGARAGSDPVVLAQGR